MVKYVNIYIYYIVKVFTESVKNGIIIVLLTILYIVLKAENYLDVLVAQLDRAVAS